ncbi:aspartate ammonia-lyase [Desulfoplanes sp. PS50]
MTRHEHDCIGDIDVPDDVLYGAQTHRALQNFRISRIPISHYPMLIRALAFIKKAAAQTNHELGLLETEPMQGIVSACDEILAGKHLQHFVVDAIQGGAGTSTNMNANEVIANRGLEIVGRCKGEYACIHPNTHVNMSQSTNDVYPTAIRIALIFKIRDLMKSMKYLKTAFNAKAEVFSEIIKMGRTQLQDAVPMTLGQEFASYATMIGEDIHRLDEAQSLVREVNLGGTAIGTGLNAHPAYARKAVERLTVMTGLPLIVAPNLVEATQDTGAYVQLSGVLKRVAVKLSKICNDLRLLSSGPRCGFNEINLPRMAPGSSIMPGKVNPIIPEVVNQIAFQVIGSDVTISMACEAGQLELNVMEPVVAFNLFNSLDMLRRGCMTLADKCIRGITANQDVCRSMVEKSIGVVTALNPYIGYEKSTEIAHEAMLTHKTVYDIVLEKGYLTKTQLDDILSPANMIAPRYVPHDCA